MTLYETRQVLIGFRLKLHFDPTLRQQDAFVFVDLSKTPTVGALLQDIANRFEIPRRDLSLALESCKLLLSEDVCVLANVEDARICVSSTDKSHKQPALKNVIPETKNTDERSCSTEIQHSSNVSEFPSDNINDSNKKNETKIPKIYRSHTRQGLAYFLQKLREKHNNSTEKDDKSNAELEIDTQKSETKSKKNCDVSSSVNMNSDINSCNGDISESAPNDNQEFVPDVRKRKRKRKHQKKTRDEENIIAESAFYEPFVAPASTPRSRTHIYFKDDEDEENKTEEVNMDTIDSHDSKFTSIEMPSKSTYDNNTSLKDTCHAKQKEGVIFKTITTNDSQLTKAPIHYHSFSPFITSKTSISSSDAVKDDTCTDSVSKKITKETDATDLEKAKISNGNRSPNYIPSSPINFEKQLSTFTFPKQKRSNLPFLQQNLKKSEESEQKIEEKLSTLLMYKDLKTYNHYTVQFLNQNYSDQPKNSSNEILKEPCNNTENLSFDSTSSCTVNKKETSIFKDDVQMRENMKSKKIENDVDKVENKTSDCEVLKEFKLSETHLLMRKPNDDWVLVTPSVAVQEFPLMEVPKENQTIVFQVYYLDEKHGPTMSDLICAQIALVKGENVAIDIPQQLQQKIFLSSLEGIGLEEHVPVSGTTFQVPFSHLKNVRLVS